MTVEYLSKVAARMTDHVPLFRGLTKGELTHFLAHTQRHALAAGKTVFREGDSSRSMYVVLRGCVEVSQEIGGTPGNTVELFQAGQCFGEMALANGGPRSATATATDACALLGFSEDLLCRIERVERIVYKNLATVVASRCRVIEDRLAPHLRPDCFRRKCFNQTATRPLTHTARIDTQLMTGLVRVGRVQRASGGQCLAWEGSNAQALFVVLEGAVEVSRSGDATLQQTGRLERGQAFGEISFLGEGLTRNATVTAERESTILRIEARDLEKSPRLATAVFRMIARNLAGRLHGLNRLLEQLAIARCSAYCLGDRPTDQQTLPGAVVVAASKGCFAEGAILN